MRTHITTAKINKINTQKRVLILLINISFTILVSAQSLINGHEYVDLGLPSGLKWATCNVGTDTSEEFNDSCYFIFGQTTPKMLSKVPSKEEMRAIGVVDSTNNLNITYDIARQNWGGRWRMPTKAELEELKLKCTWVWTTLGDSNGYKVTGPNGNSIFLPASGGRCGNNLYCVGRYGLYLSSTDYGYSGNGSYIFGLVFYNENIGVGWIYSIYGCNVRPVLD